MVKSSTRSRLLIIVSAAALGLSAAPTRAGGILRAWTKNLGGPFDLATNWNPLGAPAALDTALIEAGTLYTITFSQSVSNEFLIVDDVDVTLDLPPLVEYALNGALGRPGPDDRLTSSSIVSGWMYSASETAVLLVRRIVRERGTNADG